MRNLLQNLMQGCKSLSNGLSSSCFEPNYQVRYCQRYWRAVPGAYSIPFWKCSVIACTTSSLTTEFSFWDSFRSSLPCHRPIKTNFTSGQYVVSKNVLIHCTWVICQTCTLSLPLQHRKHSTASHHGLRQLGGAATALHSLQWAERGTAQWLWGNQQSSDTHSGQSYPCYR